MVIICDVRVCVQHSYPCTYAVHAHKLVIAKSGVGYVHVLSQATCTKVVAVELMNVSRLYNLNEQKVEELLCLLVFVWSPRSERWPR